MLAWSRREDPYIIHTSVHTIVRYSVICASEVYRTVSDCIGRYMDTHLYRIMIHLRYICIVDTLPIHTDTLVSPPIHSIHSRYTLKSDTLSIHTRYTMIENSVVSDRKFTLSTFAYPRLMLGKSGRGEKGGFLPQHCGRRRRMAASGSAPQPGAGGRKNLLPRTRGALKPAACRDDARD